MKARVKEMEAEAAKVRQLAHRIHPPGKTVSDRSNVFE